MIVKLILECDTGNDTGITSWLEHIIMKEKGYIPLSYFVNSFQKRFGFLPMDPLFTEDAWERKNQRTQKSH